MEDSDSNGLGYQGAKYTWSNNQEGPDFTKERIDRSLGNPQWISNFKEFGVSSLVAYNSDHNSILINLSSNGEPERRHRRMFRYETYWGRKGECSNLIQEAWQGQTYEEKSLAAVRKRLTNCKYKLIRWSQDFETATKGVLEAKQVQIKSLQETNIGNHTMEIKQIQTEVSQMLEVEDLKWKQQAKQR